MRHEVNETLSSVSVLPLGENVPVGAAVLHGDAVATVWGVVAYGVEGAVFIIVGNVLQDRRVPHEAKVTVFHLRRGRNRYSKDASLFLVSFLFDN